MGGFVKFVDGKIVQAPFISSWKEVLLAVTAGLHRRSRICLDGCDILLPGPAWLSYLEEQSTARNRRVGHDKETYVYRLLAEQTIDVTIKKRQEQRGTLNNTVFRFQIKDNNAYHQAVARAYGITLQTGKILPNVANQMSG